MLKSLIKYIMIIYFFYPSIGAQNYGSWTSSDSLNMSRAYSASIVLPNGNVLVTGGEGDNTGAVTNTCELYDYKANTWTYAASMNSPRFYHQLILLDSNSVIAIGGYRDKSCEIYNIKENTWRYTDSLKQDRLYGFTTNLLNDGRIIIVGGFYISEDLKTSYYLKDVELFDPQKEEWQKTDSLLIGRDYQTATLLKDGKLLVVGGDSAGGECEVYDPSNENWTIADSLNQQRYLHSAVLLENGNVLISGGEDYTNPTNRWLSGCELYNYLENKWELVTPMYFAHGNHSAIVLANGTILFVGGQYGTEVWELYDPSTFTNIYYGNYPISQYVANIEKLPNGNVISIGGLTAKGFEVPVISSTTMCELYSYITKVEKKKTIAPSTIYLFQNFPNPFNPTTEISYTITQPSFVKISVFDVSGKLLTTLVNKEKEAGTFKVLFNAEKYSSGIYFYQLQANNFIITKKMVLLR